VTEFKLSPADRAVTGIRVRRGRLRLLPTAPVLVLGSVLVVMGLAAVGVAFIAWPLGIQLWFGAMGLLWVVTGWRSATARVTANGTTVRIRNHWRTRRVGWEDVACIASEQRHNRWGRLPYSSPWRGPKEFTVGTVTLMNGDVIVCDALASEPLGAGWASPKGQVVAEVKAAVLTRWQEHISTQGASSEASLHQRRQ